MDGLTATQALATLLLGEPLRDVVLDLRRQGYSWGQVASKVASDTDGVVTVTRETYRLWYGGDPEMAHD